MIAGTLSSRSRLVFGVLTGNRLRNIRVRTGQARATRQGHGSASNDQSVSGDRRSSGGVELQNHDARYKGSSDDEKSTTYRLYSGAVALGTSAAAAMGFTSDRTIMVQTLGSEKKSSRVKSCSPPAQTTTTSTDPHTASTHAASADIEMGGVIDGAECDQNTSAAYSSLGRIPLAGPAAAMMLQDATNGTARGSFRESPTLEVAGAGGPIEENSEEERGSGE